MTSTREGSSRPIAASTDRRHAARGGGRLHGAHLRAIGVARAAIRTIAAVALAAAMVAAGAPASGMTAAPCPGTRFLVDAPLVPGTTLHRDAVVVDAAGDVSIASGCSAAHARVAHRASGSSVRAHWTTCGPLRSVRLTARIDDPACTTLTATFTARGTKRRRFTAPASVCGDGVLDPDAGEQCESAADCAGGTPCTGCVCGTAPATTTTGVAPTTTSTTRTTTTSTRTTTT